jgi:hypothetical protein
VSYFVISTSEDGVFIYELTKAEVTKRLAEYSQEGRGPTPFPTNGADPNYWGTSLVVIKGEVVQPKIVETVTRWEVP